MMRHWNDIAGTLFKSEVYVPLLLEDQDGTVHGNDWARGFMRGMGMRHGGWAELVNDEEHGGCLIPMMMLCHEHDYAGIFTGRGDCRARLRRGIGFPARSRQAQEL
jgi:uncharacterized protein